MDLGWLTPFCISFALCVMTIVLNRTASAQLKDLNAVQAMHVRPTSRFGGVAVLIVFVAGLLAGPYRSDPVVLLSITCVSPIVFVGVREDAGYHLTPVWRLLAAICSALRAFFGYGLVIENLGFPQFDFLFQHQAVAIAFTVFVLTGVTHSFNLMDGLHGLCGFTSAVIAVALALISMENQQDVVAQELTLLVAALLGFLILNFPRGLLFLGDAGATSIGFILACVALKLMQSNTDLSPWAIALVFFWPMADTILAIVRRVTRKQAAMKPDRMHFHHVVMRAFEILVLRKKNRAISNPVATVILLPLISAPSIVGVVFWNRDGLALSATVIFAVLFLASYQALVRRAQHRLGVVLGGGFRSTTTLNHRGGISE